MALILTARGRAINTKAGPREIAASLKPGALVSAVRISGRGRRVSGRFERMVNGRIKIDSEAETLATGDVCAIKLVDEGAIHDGETTTN